METLEHASEGTTIKGKCPEVMIGCPISTGRSYILQEYLKHLYELDYPKKKIHIAFLFNHPKSGERVAVPQGAMNQPTYKDDEVDQIRRTLQNFKRRTRKQYRKISIHEYAGNYEDRTIQGRRALGRWMDYFAEIRNKFVGMRDKKDDYVFSVDSDILIPKDSLKRLLEHNVDICSLLIANGPITNPHISPNRLENFMLPFILGYGGVATQLLDFIGQNGRMAFNVMMKYNTVKTGVNNYDTVNYRHVDPAELHVREAVLNYDSGVYFDNLKSTLKSYPELGPWRTPRRYGPLVEVDMTGACYLIDSKVLDDGVEYGFHHQGEDCYFSAMAQEHGFKLFCDYTLKASHIMNEEVYRAYLMSKALRVVGLPQPEKPVDLGGMQSTMPVHLEKVESY